MAMGLSRFRHIAVEGPIGAGKTSLARRLARHLGAELLLERPEENPFLERFYGDMPGYVFQVQLSFLFQRLRQVQSFAQAGIFAQGLVSDFVFDKDALFARLNLNDDEHRLYTQMYAQVVQQVRPPDLVIWLQASAATLLQRVRQRGIGMEQGISLEYLQRLCDGYVEHFHAYCAAPVFAVGTEHFNPVDRDEDFAGLLQRLEGFEGRRESFHSHVELPLE
jgi:deoxyadenosine/deoxycytidine kinase